MESEIKKKKKLRRKARAGYRIQKQKNKEAVVLALQENRNQQEVIESIKKKAQKLDYQNENISSLNNSIENKLQSKESSQLSANFMLSSPSEQELSQDSEKTVGLLQPGEYSLVLSGNQYCSPTQSKNTEAEKLDHPNENVFSLHDSIKDKLQFEENSQLSTDFMNSSSLEQKLSQAKNLDNSNKTMYDSPPCDNMQSEENCQPSADFMQSPSLEQQKLPQDNEEKIKLSQENNVSPLCQNRIEKFVKIEEEQEKELSSSANIKLLLLKQEKLFIQYKNRIEQLELQNQMLASFKKYIRLCNKHEEEVFKLNKKLIEYELQIAQKKEKLK